MQAQSARARERPVRQRSDGAVRDQEMSLTTFVTGLRSRLTAGVETAARMTDPVELFAAGTVRAMGRGISGQFVGSFPRIHRSPFRAIVLRMPATVRYTRGEIAQ